MTSDGVTVVPNTTDQAQIDDLAQQVLGARDAALGAEIELGVARARITELEHQLHLREVELTELRARMAASGWRAGARRTGPGAAGLDGSIDLARTSAMRVGRRVRRSLTS
jgi:hypothetical protein